MFTVIFVCRVLLAKKIVYFLDPIPYTNLFILIHIYIVIKTKIFVLPRWPRGWHGGRLLLGEWFPEVMSSRLGRRWSSNIVNFRVCVCVYICVIKYYYRY